MSATVLSEVIPGWEVGGEPLSDRLDAELLARAYRYSERAHAGQKRKSGEEYVTHCDKVAQIFADRQLD